MNIKPKFAFPLLERKNIKYPSGDIVEEIVVQRGMTLREYYAGLAMQSLVTICMGYNQEEIAEGATNIATALIEKLNKDKEI